MDAREPVVGCAADLVVRAPDDVLPARRVIDDAGCDVPIPEPVVRTARGERVARLARGQLGRGTPSPAGDDVHHEEHGAQHPHEERRIESRSGNEPRYTDDPGDRRDAVDRERARASHHRADQRHDHQQPDVVLAGERVRPEQVDDPHRDDDEHGIQRLPETAPVTDARVRDECRARAGHRPPM